MNSHSRSKDVLRRVSSHQAEIRKQHNRHRRPSSPAAQRYFFQDSVDDKTTDVSTSSASSNTPTSLRHPFLVQELIKTEKNAMKDFARPQKVCIELEPEFLTPEENSKGTMDSEINTDKFQVICSGLGLGRNFLDHLKNVPPRIRNHRSISDWIVRLLWENYETLSFDKKCPLTKELLLSIGFESERSIETILMRSHAGNMQQHLEPWEWAAIFVEDEFKYNHRIQISSSSVENFPFQCNSKQTWFLVPQKNSPNEQQCLVKMKFADLLEGGEKQEKTEFILSELEMKQDQYTYFFHGTDHDSGKDILQRGIDLTNGRQKRDFSCGLGFYLTKELGVAFNWAQSITSKPVVLIFQVQPSFLEEFKRKSFLENRADDMKEWDKVVASFRSGDITPEIQKLVKDFDFMEGPAAKLIGRNETNQLIFQPKRLSHQICLFSETIAERFGRNLYSMILHDLS